MTGLRSVPRRLDHVMIVVPHLEEGVKQFAELTGVTPVKGGSHASVGTANYLVGVHPIPGLEGPPPYLEILGPDPEGDPAAFEGLGRVLVGDAEGPVLRMWIARATDIHAEATNAEARGYPLGEVTTLSRVGNSGELLEWSLTVRVPLGFAGGQPSLIDWGTAPHPADALEPQISFDSFELRAAEPAETSKMLEALNLDGSVAPAEKDGLAVRLSTPRGVVTISSDGVE